MKVLAIVCMRNEAVHVRRCITDFVNEGIEVHLVDHGSTDQSAEVAREFLGHGLVGIKDLPWTGKFSLSDQLRAKQQIIAATHHDWIIHADADESLRSPIEGQTLNDGIAEADAAGHTCINFNEFVFVPNPDQDFYAEDYAQKMDTYYFYQPRYPRLDRAWKRDTNLENLHSGGHQLSGQSINRFPRDFILKHYIALSEGHAIAKYVGRQFSDEDLKKGWHSNRREITPENLRLKPVPGLRRLPAPDSNEFDLSCPLKTHFWQW